MTRRLDTGPDGITGEDRGAVLRAAVRERTDGPAADDVVADASGVRPGREQELAEDTTERHDTHPDGDAGGAGAAEGFRSATQDLLARPGGREPEELGVAQDRPAEDELLDRLPGSHQGRPTQQEQAAGGPPQDDPGPPPPGDGADETPFGSKESLIGADVSLSGGAPVASNDGEVTTGAGSKQLAEDYDDTWIGDIARSVTMPGNAGQVYRESGFDGWKTSTDGVSSARRNEHDGSVEVRNTANGTYTVQNPDGSVTTYELNPDGTKGDQIDSTGQPDPDDEGVPIPDELRTGLDADLAALRRHQGGQDDPGTEIQPAGEDVAFGAGAPAGAVPPDRHDSMLGNPGGPGDARFGGGAGTARDPDSGAIDPGPDADGPPQTGGPERDPFDRPEPVEPAAEPDPGTEEASGPEPVSRVDDPADALRNLTLDAG